MKKVIFIFLFVCFYLFEANAQWTKIGSLISTDYSQVSSTTKKSGKDLYYFLGSFNAELYDEKLNKIFLQLGSSVCNNKIFGFSSINRFSNDSEYEVSGFCENGRVMIINEKNEILFDRSDKTRLVTQPKPNTIYMADKDDFEDTLRNIEIVKYINNQAKTVLNLSDVRLFQYNPAKDLFYEIRKDFTINIYDANSIALLKTIKIQNPPKKPVALCSVVEYGATDFNNDSKIEINVIFLSKGFELIEDAVYNETGNKIFDLPNRVFWQSALYVIQSTSDSTKIYQKKGMKLLHSFSNTKYIGYRTNNDFYFYQINKTNETLSFFDEVLNPIRTVSTKGYQNPQFEYITQPDGKLTIVLKEENKQIKVITPDNSELLFPLNTFYYKTDFSNPKCNKIAFSHKDVNGLKNEVHIYEMSKTIATKENILEKVKVYPNPFNLEVNIQLPEDIENLSKISLYNMMGQNVGSFEKEGQILTLDEMSKFPDGIYFLHIENGGNRLVQKIIKNQR